MTGRTHVGGPSDGAPHAAADRFKRDKKEYTTMHTNMKRTLMVLLPLLLTLALALGVAACGASANPNAPANEVDMGGSNFFQTTRTISAGQSIHFVDEQGGTTHILCIGHDGHCDAGGNGPHALLGQGFTIQPGQSRDVQFDAAGTYAITCTIHPSMNLTVTVH